MAGRDAPTTPPNSAASSSTSLKPSASPMPRPPVTMTSAPSRSMASVISFAASRTFALRISSANGMSFSSTLPSAASGFSKLPLRTVANWMGPDTKRRSRMVPPYAGRTNSSPLSVLSMTVTSVTQPASKRCARRGARSFPSWVPENRTSSGCTSRI